MITPQRLCSVSPSRSLLRNALRLGSLFISVNAFAATGDQPEQLPTYIVAETRDAPPPESWRYTRIPGFEVLSNGSDSDTKNFVRQLQLFHQAMDVVWPAMQKTLPPSSKLILCAKGGQFDAFTPADGTHAEGNASSLCLHDPDDAAIVVDLEHTVSTPAVSSTSSMGGSDSWFDAARAGQSSAEITVDPVRHLKREYVRFLLSRQDTRLPAWFEEGLVQLFLTMDVREKSIVFAKLMDPNAVSIAVADQADKMAELDRTVASGLGFALTPEMIGPPPPEEESDFNKFLLDRGLYRMGDFFAVNRDSAEIRNSVGSRWSAQAQGFVHMCLYGQNGKFVRPLYDFLGRSAKEPVTEAMFKECFGMDYSAMGLVLRGYIKNTRYKFYEFSAKTGNSLKASDITLREATEAEIGRIKGTVFRLAGHNDAARQAMIAPYIRGERDPSLLATLGVQEHLNGNDARARVLLEAAARANVVDPHAHLELARLRLAEARAHPGAPDGKLSVVQTRAVLKPLFTARAQLPLKAEVYRTIAEVWTQSATKPTFENLDVLNEGVLRFPRDQDLMYQTAVLHAQNGFAQHASVLTHRGMRLATTVEGRARFASLRTDLPADAKDSLK